MIDDTTTVVKEASAEKKRSDNSRDREVSQSAAKADVFEEDTASSLVEVTPVEVVSEAPGTILRRAREDKGLEQIEIARDLKLDVHLIDALERGELHKLPPVYTAGYIRAYAKRVDLEPDELVSEFIAQEAKHAPKLKKEHKPLPERYRRVAEALPKGFSLAAVNAKEQLTKNYGPLAAGLVILLLLVWQVFSIWSSDDAATGSDIVASQTKDDDGNMPLPSETEQTASLTAQLSSSDSMTSKIAQPAADSAATSDKKALSQSAGSNEKTQNSNVKSEASDKESAPIAQDNDNTDTIAVLEKKNSTDLVLTFNRNSWVDIRDATGKHIIRQLGIAGNTQKVSGQAPFQVLLGYGHGVTIEYNGNEVDFSAFQGDRVARFTLEVPKKKIATQ